MGDLDILETAVGEYGIVIDEKNKRFLLVQWGEEFDHTWHFVGGLMETEDRETEGLLREAKEELRAELEIHKPVFTKHVGEDLLWDPEDPTRYAVFYLCTLKNPKALEVSAKEIVAFKWFTREDLPEINFFLPFYREMLEQVLPF